MTYGFELFIALSIITAFLLASTDTVQGMLRPFSAYVVRAIRVCMTLALIVVVHMVLTQSPEGRAYHLIAVLLGGLVGAYWSPWVAWAFVRLGAHKCVTGPQDSPAGIPGYPEPYVGDKKVIDDVEYTYTVNGWREIK